MGPEASYDPRRPLMPQRVQRGGSFLCNASYCASYRPAARMPCSPDTGMSQCRVSLRKLWQCSGG